MLSFLSSHCEKIPLKEMLTHCNCVPESRRGGLKEIELPLMEINSLLLRLELERLTRITAF